MPKPDWTSAYHQCLPTDVRQINGQTMYVIEGVPQLNTFFCGEYVRDDVSYHLVYCIRDINEPLVDHPIIDGVQFAQHVDYMPRHADYDQWPEPLQTGDTSGIVSTQTRELLERVIQADTDPYAVAELYAALFETSRLGDTFEHVVADCPWIIQPITETDPDTGETWTRSNVWRCNLEPEA